MKESDTKQFNWDVCGHEEIVHFLQSAISGNKLANAYLFSGPSQLGKQAVAYKLIASLFCQNQEKAKPCGVCPACLQIKNKIHPDFFITGQEMNEKTEKLSKGILIEQIRNLKHKLQQATLLNGYKVALITDAHLMNLNTANALLKILEEPTKNTVIILLVDDVSALPQTIASRCQTLRFLPVPTATIKTYLEDQGSFESGLVARQAHGYPGIAIDLVNNQDLIKTQADKVETFLKIIDADLNQRLELVEKAVNWEKDESINVTLLNDLFHSWQLVLRDALLIKTDNESLITNTTQLEAIKSNFASMSFIKIKSILNKMDQVSGYTWYNINSKSALENLIINL
ncbi:DNA polymerase III subunit delta' [Candidatus Falkowbacteria bacterium]|nr:DNA polymerase III subunit delta' [Candidatus Falkowbacteria bacterium]